MNLPFYIARRYLFAKKTQTAVNVLTLIAVVGISVGTMALVIVLSVFNGFEKLIMSFFNAMNADLEITAAEGKTFVIDDLPIEEIQALPGVLYVGKMIEETALITYKDKQHIVTLRGVDEHFQNITGIDTMMVEGVFETQKGDRDYLILGQGTEQIVSANINDFLTPLVVYIPKRGRVSSVMHPGQAFNASSIYVSGIFNVHIEYDAENAFTSFELMRSLMEYDREVTSVLVGLNPERNHKQWQKRISQMAGESFIVKNKFQQEEFFYKIMKSEKWAIFMILSFILLIAAFNITGSLTMLVLEKQKDIRILWSMGANMNTIKKIFLFEGLLIGLGGALLGILFGGLVCWIQIEFGVVALQAQGSFIVDAYPVHVKVWDFVLVFFTVAIMGMLASLLPINKIPSLIVKAKE